LIFIHLRRVCIKEKRQNLFFRFVRTRLIFYRFFGTKHFLLGSIAYIVAGQKSFFIFFEKTVDRKEKMWYYNGTDCSVKQKGAILFQKPC